MRPGTTQKGEDGRALPRATEEEKEGEEVPHKRSSFTKGVDNQGENAVLEGRQKRWGATVDRPMNGGKCHQEADDGRPAELNPQAQPSGGLAHEVDEGIDESGSVVAE